MVGLQGREIVPVALQASTKDRKVDVGGDLVRFARSIGTCLGD